MDFEHFISSSEDVIEKEEKVTFEQLLSIATNPRKGWLGSVTNSLGGMKLKIL